MMALDTKRAGTATAQRSLSKSLLAQRSLYGSAALLLVSLALGACSGKRDVLGCNSDEACPAGHLCLASQCEQICANDNECAAGQICSDGLCVSGSRQAPTIQEVLGNSAQTCVQSTEVDAIEPTGPCVRDGFIVKGQNLAGALFTLIGGPSLGEVYTLTPRGTPSAQQVELVPAVSTIAAGVYKLVAANQAGESETTVQLLRGEPGASGELTLVKNGTVSTHVRAGHRMHVSINAATGSVDLDHSKFQALCGDDDGCIISVGASYLPWGNDPIYPPAPTMGRPCRVFLKDNHWSIDRGCARDYIVGDRNKATIEVADLKYYSPYFSGGFGTDGDNNNSFPIVLNYEFICMLSEAPPNFTDSNFGADNAVGFHFFMVDKVAWAGPSNDIGTPVGDMVNSWLAQSNRTCELTIYD